MILSMSKLFTIFIVLVFPRSLKPFFLRLLGHKVHNSAKIGFSIIRVSKLHLDEKAKIGNFNYIKINELTLYKNALIGSMNKISGDLSIFLEEVGIIRDKNSISRAYFPITYGTSFLKIGKYAAITHGHMLDLTRSIVIGDYTTLAGSNSQLWTHGYFHAKEGLDRVRVDGEIIIGNNVYIGSRCIFNAGIKIANGITVGSNCCISKSLYHEGMYVSQPLRYISNDISNVRAKLKRIDINGLEDEVYEKSIN